MGERDVTSLHDHEQRQRFARALLDDIAVLDEMVRAGALERGQRRIGVEQEMFLVRPSGRPAAIALEALEQLSDSDVTTEIGLFNLEHNVAPRNLAAGCLRSLEADLHAKLAEIRAVAQSLGADVCLAGILPTIQLADLTLANLTPLPRYRALNEAITRLSGGAVRTLIQGRDNLQLALDSIMLETCNTSIQLHLQVDVEELPRIYNLAQLVSGPAVAVAANSPLLLQHRLWHETRIPTFEQSVDVRSTGDRQRDSWQRVHFGDDWVGSDILDVYRDQVARHRITLMGETGESSREVRARGGVPSLRALSLHNGSLYRWNRLCYGVTGGRPHLRIEHRPIAAGPTVVDEVANCAFFLGMVLGLEASGVDARREFAFSDAKSNFIVGARYGLESSMRWLNGRVVPVKELITSTLLPLAREGLRGAGLDESECSRYLDIIAERAATGTNGATWTLDAYNSLGNVPSRCAKAGVVTRAMMARQWSNDPMHTWTPITAEERESWTDHCATVGELMTTDLFTVREDDLLDVAASVMHWKHIRHVPVLNDQDELVGLISHRALLNYLISAANGAALSTAQDVMATDVTVLSPLDSCDEALRVLQRTGMGSLPVAHEGRLVGMLSERDFLPLVRRARGHPLPGTTG